MRTTFGALAIAATLFCGSAVAADLPSRAEPAPLPPVPSSWQFQATAYGWLTALEGDVGVRYRQPVSVDLPFSKILDHLKGTFMGAFQAKNDTWMFLGDLVWSKLGATPTLRYGGQLDIEQTLGIATGYVGYRLPFGPPELDVRLLAGVRGQRLTADITHYGVVTAFDRSGSQTKQWVDPLVGIGVTYAINKNWFVNAIGDIGGFSVGSNLTAQGFLAVGYKWTDNISTSLGYRALYTDYEKGGFSYQTTMHGVFLGLGIHF